MHPKLFILFLAKFIGGKSCPSPNFLKRPRTYERLTCIVSGWSFSLLNLVYLVVEIVDVILDYCF